MSDNKESFSEALLRIVHEPREKWIQDLYDLLGESSKTKLTLVKDSSKASDDEPIDSIKQD